MKQSRNTTQKPKHVEKRNVEFYAVIRRNGKIEAQRKLDTKFTLSKAKAKFNLSGTILEQVTMTALTNVREWQDYRPKARSPVVSYQGIAIATDRKGKMVASARSLKQPWASREAAIENALDNLFSRLGGLFAGDSDAAIGQAFAAENDFSISTGIVYYKPL